jgi:anti-sigma regulatory factor (Ser/Thr protein kinase)
VRIPTDKHLACNAESPRRAREFVNEVLERNGVTPGVRDDAVLLVSEVVTNAVRHAHSDATVAVALMDDHLRIDVTDDGPGWPERHAPAGEHGGYGLHLVAQLAGTWGVSRVGGEKTVWFELRQH